MKVGFVAILGRPNVGKSTLLNNILQYKVSITSSTPQTTRDQIKGIFNDEDSQIIFIDTPGIHKPKQKLGESLNEASYSSMKDAEVVLFLQPANELIGPGDRHVIDKIKTRNAVAVITKLDTSTMDDVKVRAEELKALGFKEVIGVSDKIPKSIDHLIAFIKENLEEGIPFYDREDITDLSMRFIAKEVIRESAIENTKDEVPHSIGVEIDEYKEPSEENKLTSISATIYVERESQKGILVGAQGSMIKKIGSSARAKLEESLGEKIFLRLKVKVNKNWTNDEKQIKKMGY